MDTDGNKRRLSISFQNTSLDQLAKKPRETTKLNFTNSTMSETQSVDSTCSNMPSPVLPTNNIGMKPIDTSSPNGMEARPASTISDFDIGRIATAVRIQVVAEMESIYGEQIERMKSAIDLLQEENKILNRKIDDLEMYSRKSCVRITGISEDDPLKDPNGKVVKVNENTTQKIVAIAKVIGADITESDIEVSHRVGRRDTDKPRQIIARINNSDKRHELLAKSKYLSKAADKKHIHINQELTKSRAKVAYEARKLVREHKLKYTSVWDGKILMTDLQDRKHVAQSLDEFLDVVRTLGMGSKHDIT